MTRPDPGRAAVRSYCAANGWRDHNGAIQAQCTICARTVREPQLRAVQNPSSQPTLAGSTVVVCRFCAARIVKYGF
jgi:hypothetical protein